MDSQYLKTLLKKTGFVGVILLGLTTYCCAQAILGSRNDGGKKIKRASIILNGMIQTDGDHMILDKVDSAMFISFFISEVGPEVDTNKIRLMKLTVSIKLKNGQSLTFRSNSSNSTFRLKKDRTIFHIRESISKTQLQKLRLYGAKALEIKPWINSDKKTQIFNKLLEREIHASTVYLLSNKIEKNKNTGRDFFY